MKILHVLQSLSLEGSPRLATGLLEQASLRRHSGVVLPLDATPRDLAPELEAAGVPVLQPIGWSGRDHFSMMTRVRRVFREQRFDGVICYTLGAHLPIAIVARMMKIPMLLHIGNAPPDDPSSRRKIAWQLRIGRPFVRMHVACSAHVRRRVIHDYGMPPSAVVAILNGIDLPRFLSVRERRAAADKSCLVGMVGSLEVHKDQSTLIRALAALVAHDVDARLELVGGGSREQELKRLATELGVLDRVVWTGRLTDVREALQRFDVFGYAVSDQEGLGIALIEALAAGVPCVATDTGACREVLEDGGLGTLVRGEGSESWADAIVAAAGRPPVPAEHLLRFDISSTAIEYERLLGAS